MTDQNVDFWSVNFIISAGNGYIFETKLTQYLFVGLFFVTKKGCFILWGIELIWIVGLWGSSAC